MVKMITQAEANRIRLKGKPKCPYCRKPLTYVYEDSKGHTGEKCRYCNNQFVINMETLEVFQISRAG